MDRIVLYHNPRCSKSRAALALLQERGVEVELVHYLEDPLDRPQLEALGKALGLEPSEWVRSGEPAYAAAGLSADSSADAIREAMLAHPILMQRPIALREGRAVIGRPPENVLNLL